MANVFDPRGWSTQENDITLEVMRVVLATGLFAVGVELPCAYMKDHAKSLLIMVIPTMAFGWVVVSGTSFNLRTISLSQCLDLFNSCLTCTLPCLERSLSPLHRCLPHSNGSSHLRCHHSFVSLTQYLTNVHSISRLGGKFATKHVPVDIRRILSAESAANDGLAYPFLSIAIYLTVETSTRAAVGKWLLIGCLCEFVDVQGTPFTS